MNRIKCKPCGLINSVDDGNCRRCGVNLHSEENAPPRYVPDYPRPEPNRSAITFGRILMVLIVFAFLGFAAYYVKVMRPEHIAEEKKRVQEDIQSRKVSDEIQKRHEREDAAWKREREYEKKVWEENKRKAEQNQRDCPQGCVYR